MEKIIFEAHALTPLFLAGADLGEAELRAPTLRGLLRYWLRTLVGGIVGTDEQGLEATWKTESVIFGNTNMRSAITVQVSGASQEARAFHEKITIRQGVKWLSTGRGYLLWSMTKRGRQGRDNFKAARWYYPAGTSFQIALSARETSSQQLKQAIAAFWLLTQLGGIGSRSRRCAGSIQASLQDSSAILADLPHLPFVQAAHSQVLKQQLEAGIASARKLMTLETRPVQDARFDILASGTCRIWILQDKQPWHSAEWAMQEIGERLQAYHSRLSIEQRKIFGLPLAKSTPNARRASPLHLRITRLNGARYVCVAVLFKTVNEDVRMQDYEVIEQWSDAFGRKMEVRL